MTDKDILYQIIGREVSNILGSLNPTFRMFSNAATGYVISIIDPYVDAFLSGGQINTKAASGFIKQEISSKIDEFMKSFEAERNNDL